MNVIDPISAVLNQKGREIWHVAPATTVFEAIQMMADKDVGALLVMEDGKLLGLVSERDYTRKVILRGKLSKKTLVHEIMAAPVVTVSPQQSVETAMRIMTEKRVRHLPVIEGSKVTGVVSIGNLVNWIISAQTQTIHHLESYISGQYPG